jgi:hypothetical protein
MLGFDPEVMKSANVATTLMLESRAPCVSHEDRSFLATKFENGSLFPLLKDDAMCKAIETVVYRQGPILTMRTFARDIRVLGSKIMKPLRSLLGRMTPDTTVRSELLPRFEQRYVDYQPTAAGLTNPKRDFANRCYQ